MALRSVPESADPSGRRLDPQGQALAILALGMLALVAIEAPHWGWTSPAILACLAVAIAAAALFLRVEAGKPGALVPLALFRGRDFSAAMAITALMTFGMYGLLFLMPLYLQAVRGASAFVAGVELLPMSLTFVVVSQCSGMLARRLGARLMMVLGMGLMGAGLLLLAPIGEGTGLVAIELAFFIIGVGLGLNTGPVLGVAVASVPPARSGTASGLANTARMVGATLGVAILGALFALHAGEAAASGVAASAGSGAILAGLRLAFLGGGAAELLGGAIAFVVRPDALEHHAA
jgi:predicted MFS family arabinose efflux permease